MRWNRLLDTLALLAISLMLMTAFYYQLALNDLPCALCNLQRASFMTFGGGLLLNLVQQRPSRGNYVISAVGAAIGGLIALLQMFVHVLPGTPPTGTAVLGLHMYDWAYIAFTIAGLYVVAMLAGGLPQAAAADATAEADAALVGRAPLTQVTIMLFAVLTLANLASTFLENGFAPMKSGGQQHYVMLYSGDVMQP